MIFNDTLKAEYGDFNGGLSTSNILRHKPSLTESEYNRGFITRYFAKKVNENIIIEVSNSTAVKNTNPLYKMVSIDWKISGPKHDMVLNGILEKAGVVEQNKSEIDRVLKEDGVDLSHVLRNHTEYWKGS